MKKVEKLNNISLEGVTGGTDPDPEEVLMFGVAPGVAGVGGLVTLGTGIASKVLKSKANKQTDEAKAKKMEKASRILDNVAVGSGAVTAVGGIASFASGVYCMKERRQDSKQDSN